MSKSKILVCLDSSVIISDLFHDRPYGLEHNIVDIYVEKNKLVLYISNTVKEEVECRIKNRTKKLGELLKDIKNKLEQLNLNKNIEMKDMEVIQKMFIKLKQENKNNFIRIIEEEIIIYITENYKQKPVKIDVLIKISSNIILGLIATYNKYLLKYSVFTNEPNKEAQDKLKLSKEMIKTNRDISNDIKIICEVASFQLAKKKQGILVTLDYNDILNNAERIYKITKIRCCDPIYLPMEININSRDITKKSIECQS